MKIFKNRAVAVLLCVLIVIASTLLSTNVKLGREADGVSDGFYKGVNTLYKDENALYQLIVHQSSCTANDFNKVCNILSEYGSGRAFNPAGEAHLKEHGELILTKALQQLAEI